MHQILFRGKGRGKGEESRGLNEEGRAKKGEEKGRGQGLPIYIFGCATVSILCCVSQKRP